MSPQGRGLPTNCVGRPTGLCQIAILHPLVVGGTVMAGCAHSGNAAAALVECECGSA